MLVRVVELLRRVPVEQRRLRQDLVAHDARRQAEVRRAHRVTGPGFRPRRLDVAGVGGERLRDRGRSRRGTAGSDPALREDGRGGAGELEVAFVLRARSAGRVRSRARGRRRARSRRRRRARRRGPGRRRAQGWRRRRRCGWRRRRAAVARPAIDADRAGARRRRCSEPTRRSPGVVVEPAPDRHPLDGRCLARPGGTRPHRTSARPAPLPDLAPGSGRPTALPPCPERRSPGGPAAMPSTIQPRSPARLGRNCSEVSGRSRFRAGSMDPGGQRRSSGRGAMAFLEVYNVAGSYKIQLEETLTEAGTETLVLGRHAGRRHHHRRRRDVAPPSRAAPGEGAVGGRGPRLD